MRLNPSRILRVIALIEFAGGVLGAVIAAVVAPRLAAQPNVSVSLIVLWLVPPFALSLVAGALLWRGGSAGEVLSLINLVLQIPVLDTPAISYFFNTGVALRLWISTRGPGWYFFLGSQFHINLAPQTAGVLLGVNVVAVGLLGLLIYGIPEDADANLAGSAAAHSA